MATGQDLLGLDEFPGTGPAPDDTQFLAKSPRLATQEFRLPGSRLPGGFLPLLVSELNADKASYAGLALRPLLIKIINALGTGSGGGSNAKGYQPTYTDTYPAA